MGLENPVFIADLAEANPATLDQQHEGDDHLRNIKKAVRNTFPGMVGRAWRAVSRAAGGAITLNENMTIQKCAGGITLVPDAAATLGNGFITLVRAGGGNVVIDPVQNINGGANYTVPDGYTAILMCDGTEFFAVLVYQGVPPTAVVFPAGTRMLFQQTAAPAGWTKVTLAAYNDAAMRVTTGTVATGGGDPFTTLFGVGKSTSNHTLTLAQIPAHTHNLDKLAGSNTTNSNLFHNLSNDNTAGQLATASAGGGGAHSHGLPNMNLKYVDVIVCTKD